jgi:hypothetical protein
LRLLLLIAVELGPDSFNFALEPTAVFVGYAVGEAIEQRDDARNGIAILLEEPKLPEI